MSDYLSMSVPTLAKTFLLTRSDTSTEEGRSRERHRRAALTALSSGALKAVQLFTALISVPLCVTYLGTERYGLWVTISSLVGMLGFSDLGMGNGLLNLISEAQGRKDRRSEVTLVSSGFFMLLAAAAALLLGFGMSYQWIPWHSLFHSPLTDQGKEVRLTVFVFLASFALSLPLGVAQKTQLGHQQGYLSNLWQLIGSLLGLAGLLWAISSKRSLPWLALCVSGAPILASGLNCILYFGRQERWLLPKWHHLHWDAACRLTATGLMFLSLQITALLAYTSDNLVAAHFLGAAAVAQYSVAYRLFMFCPAIIGLVLSPLWPAYGEATARGDVLWVQRTLRRTVFATFLLSGTAALLLLAFAQPIFTGWVGPSLAPPFWLALGLAFWLVMQTTCGAVAIYLNGSSHLRFQIILSLAFGISSLVLKVLLVQQFGLTGIIWGTILPYSIIVVPSYYFIVPRLMRNTPAVTRRVDIEYAAT